MLSRGISQQSLRRFTVLQPTSLSRTAVSRWAVPSSIAMSQTYVQSRPAVTQSLKPDEAHQLLIQQRLNRPISPHLTIYKAQIPWYLSALNRITAAILSGGFYIFGSAYLVAPLFNWHLESGTIAAAFGALPVLLKVLLKFGVSLPFTFHSWNGIRHLVWDVGRELSNKQVVRTGQIVLGLTLASSVALAVI